MDPVRDLIMERLKQADLTLTQASLHIGRNASYLQQFVKRGVPTELRERERVRLAQLLRVSEDQLRDKSQTVVAQDNWRRDSEGDDNLYHFRKAQARVLDYRLDNPRSPPIMSRDLPVYGTAENSGGNDSGALRVSNDPVDSESRPDFLARNTGAYALIIVGDTMDPECKHGSRVIVDPHLPARDGDTCVFRARNADGSLAVRVNVLRSSNERAWLVRQHNPKKDFELKKADYPEAHTVVGNYYRR